MGYASLTAKTIIKEEQLIMSQWENLGMDEKITRILDVQSHDPDHRFGRPFLTSYQIAIRFQESFPEEFRTIDKPTGGKGIGRHDSLAQYIAHQLSTRIKDGQITNIEGKFLSRLHLHTLQYENGAIESSSMQAYDLSIFRLCD